MIGLVGRRSSVRRANLVVTSVLLLVLCSLPLLVLSCLPLLLLHPRSANVRFLGSSSLSGPPLRAPRLRAKALCSTTGSARSPIAGTVDRPSPRLELHSNRSGSGRSCWPWRLSYGQLVTRRQRSVLRSPSSPTRLLKASNASKKCGCAEDKTACGNA